jgi:hypothetical protein
LANCSSEMDSMDTKKPRIFMDLPQKHGEKMRISTFSPTTPHPRLPTPRRLTLLLVPRPVMARGNPPNHSWFLDIFSNFFWDCYSPRFSKCFFEGICLRNWHGVKVIYHEGNRHSGGNSWVSPLGDDLLSWWMFTLF